MIADPPTILLVEDNRDDEELTTIRGFKAVVCVDSDQARNCCRERAKGAPANNLRLVERVQTVGGSGCPIAPVVIFDRRRTSPL